MKTAPEGVSDKNIRPPSGPEISDNDPRKRSDFVGDDSALRYLWEVRPVPRYIPPVLSSDTTIAKEWFPKPLWRSYSAFRRTGAYRLLGLTIKLLYFVGILTIWLTVENVSEHASASCGAITAVVYFLFYCHVFPEFHTVILKKIFVQFDSWFYVSQSLPTIYVLGNRFLCCERLRIGGILSAIVFSSFNTLTMDSYPQATNTVARTKVAVLGALLPICVLLR